jgi:hypothetical protein
MARGDGSKIIWHNQPNIYGRYFKCSKRSSAHMDWTKNQLAKKAAKDGKTYRFIIIQGMTNTGVSASAGTHDYDACVDVKIEGMTWAAAQRFLRSCGWAAFWRKPSQGPWSDHIHMVSLPKFMLQFVARVGIWVPGQVRDYYNKLNGLSSHAPDNTWHPKNIKETIFQYQAYIDSLSARERLENLRKRMEIAVEENSKRTVENLKKLISETKQTLGRLRDRLKR